MPMIRAELPDKYLDRYPYKTNAEILSILSEGSSNHEYQEIKSWWESEKAKLAVKKAIVAADAGVEQIFYQFIVSTGVGNNVWAHSGIISLGPSFPGSNDEPAGTARPVVYALGQLMEQTGDFTSIENLNPLSPGQDPHDWLWFFRFSNGDKKVCVLWNDSGKSIKDMSSYISTSNAKTTHIVTKLDNNNDPIYPPEETVAANSIPIEEIPIFVQPVE